MSLYSLTVHSDVEDLIFHIKIKTMCWWKYIKGFILLFIFKPYQQGRPAHHCWASTDRPTCSPRLPCPTTRSAPSVPAGWCWTPWGRSTSTSSPSCTRTGRTRSMGSKTTSASPAPPPLTPSGCNFEWKSSSLIQLQELELRVKSGKNCFFFCLN